MVLRIASYSRLRTVGARRDLKGGVVVRGDRIVVHGREET
jgi:hypothetical protein